MASSLNELSPRVQLLLFAVLAVGLVFAGEYSLLSSMETDNQALQAKVTRLDTMNSRLLPLQGQLPRLEAQNRQLELQWKHAQAMLPMRRATDDFLRELQTTAAAHGVHLRSIQAQSPLRRQYYIEAPYKLMLDGSYDAVLGYYEELNRLPRIVTISSLDMVGLNGRGGSAYTYSPGESVQAQCLITTYFSPSSADETKPAHGKSRGKRR